MKTCNNPKCKQVNPQQDEAFSLEREGKYTWRRAECIKCRSGKGKARRDPVRKEYNAYMREWNKNNPDAVKSGTLMKCYRINLDTYKQMLKKQGGTCAICPATSITGRYLCVDHDHAC